MCDVNIPPDPPYCPFALNTARLGSPSDQWDGGFYIEVVIRDSVTMSFWQRHTTVEVQFDVQGELFLKGVTVLRGRAQFGGGSTPVRTEPAAAACSWLMRGCATRRH